MSGLRIGILGTGTVGRTLATRLAALDHDVMLAGRSVDNAPAREWARQSGGATGDFAAAAAHGEIVFHCTRGETALAALAMAGEAALAGKVLVDVSNPLDFSGGMPPTLAVCNTDSLAEQIQRELPRSRVVKTLCTMNAALMVEPDSLPGDHVVFLSGDDADAKASVASLLTAFGWRHIVDLGALRTARGQEMMMPLWLSLWAALGTTHFNYAIVQGPKASAGT